MPNKSSREAILHHLQDAIAAERNFETQLKSFSRDSEQPMVRNMFAEHALQTRYQQERLTARLEALGGSASAMKSFLAHVFNLTPRSAQFGREAEQKSSQNLIVAFGIENSEIAMYEELAVAAAFAEDVTTERLARIIQEEERAAARKIWGFIESSRRQPMTATATNRGNVA